MAYAMLCLLVNLDNLDPLHTLTTLCAKGRSVNLCCLPLSKPLLQIPNLPPTSPPKKKNQEEGRLPSRGLFLGSLSEMEAPSLWLRSEGPGQQREEAAFSSAPEGAQASRALRL